MKNTIFQVEPRVALTAKLRNLPIRLKDETRNAVLKHSLKKLKHKTKLSEIKFALKKVIHVSKSCEAHILRKES